MKSITFITEGEENLTFEGFQSLRSRFSDEGYAGGNLQRWKVKDVRQWKEGCLSTQRRKEAEYFRLHLELY
jgi:hypothetical protein